VKAFEGLIQQVENKMERTDGAVKELDRKVENLSEKLSRRDENIERRVKDGENSVLEEMREREARRLNVVVHKLKEMEGERATGKERQELDRKSCVKIFEELKLSLRNKDIKFCRRLGEKKAQIRPLIIGFYMEADRATLLRNARNLENTACKHVNNQHMPGFDSQAKEGGSGYEDGGR
jgi:type I site-specific restriction-modification system R (restriction) subunit